MSLFKKREKVNTENGILAVANFVNSRNQTAMSIFTPGEQVEGYDVYLPNYINQTVAHYARWLVENPHPKVHLHYRLADDQ